MIAGHGSRDSIDGSPMELEQGRESLVIPGGCLAGEASISLEATVEGKRRCGGPVRLDVSGGRSANSSA
jgi:hypothetical protein